MSSPISFPNQHGVFQGSDFYDLFYTNHPVDTILRSDSSYSNWLHWYTNKYIADTGTLLANNQNIIYDRIETVSGFVVSSSQKIDVLKQDTQQIIGLLGGQSQSPSFNNYSSKLQAVHNSVMSIQGDLEPMFISQSFSFICGCLAAIAFVLAVKTFAR